MIAGARQLEDGSYAVPSVSDPPQEYRISLTATGSEILQAECQCPDWYYRVGMGKSATGRPKKYACKHGLTAIALHREATKEERPMADEPKPPSNIHEAIAAIYAEVGYVQKQRSAGLGYSYAGEGALIEALRPALVEHGVTVNVAGVEQIERETVLVGQKQSSQQRTTLLARVRFTHAPSGTFIESMATGEGMDSGDKSSNKAMTCALKYALRQTFLIETGDDPDDSRPELEGAQVAPAARQAPKPATPADDAVRDAKAQWTALNASMKEHGLTAADMAVVFGGKCNGASFQGYLDRDPAHNLGTAIADALALKEAASGD